MANVKKQIWVLGGTFDPPTEGHMELLRTALTKMRVLVFAPTVQNPWKKEQPVPLSQRLHMAQLMLAAENIPWSRQMEVGKVYLCDFSYSYSVELVDYLLPFADGQIQWLGGPGIREESKQWKDWARVAERVNFVERQAFAGDIHSTDVREGRRLLHRAIRAYVKEQRLYPKAK